MCPKLGHENIELQGAGKALYRSTEVDPATGTCYTITILFQKYFFVGRVLLDHDFLVRFWLVVPTWPKKLDFRTEISRW